MKTYHLRACLLIVFMSLSMRLNSVLTLAQSRGSDSTTQFNIPYLVRSDNLIWIIVGDREKIEKGIRELNIGEVQLIDADGNPVK